MVMAGVPFAEVAKMLGDTVEMIEKVYGRFSPDYLRRAADALAGISSTNVKSMRQQSGKIKQKQAFHAEN
jgi:hypothetical protein